MEEEKAIWSSKERASLEAIDEKAKLYNVEIASLSKEMEKVAMIFIAQKVHFFSTILLFTSSVIIFMKKAFFVKIQVIICRTNITCCIVECPNCSLSKYRNKELKRLVFLCHMLPTLLRHINVCMRKTLN